MATQSKVPAKPTHNGLIRMRTCPSCKIRKDVREFADKEKTGYDLCLTCLPRAEFARETQRRQEEAVRKFKRLMWTLDVPQSKRAPKISDMLVALLDEWGGPEAYIHELAMQMQRLATDKPGHPETVRLFQGILKLVHEENRRQDQADHDALTREQIEQQTQVAVFAFMSEAALDKGKAQLMWELLAPIMEQVNADSPAITVATDG